MIDHTIDISSNNLTIINGEYVQVCITVTNETLHNVMSSGEYSVNDFNEEIKQEIIKCLSEKIKKNHILFSKSEDPIDNVVRFYGRICLVPKQGVQRIKENIK